MRSKAILLLALIFSFVSLTAAAGVSPLGTGLDPVPITDRPDGCKGTTTRATLDVPSVYATIQLAVDAAIAGDEIIIAAGAHTEGGQIIVNKDVIITGAGAGATTVRPGVDTGQMSSCDTSRAFIHVPVGFTVTISNLTIDGTGQIIGSAIHSEGDLTVENCVIRNIRSSLYLGRAIGLTQGTGLIRNCTFENIERIGIHVRGGCAGTTPPAADVEHCTYTGKGAIDCLDYAVEFGGGGTGSVTNSTFTNCLGVASSDGSTSAGVLITTFFGPNTAATLRGNVLTGNTHAIAAGYDAADTSYVDARYNDFSGCVAGIMTTAAGITADLEKNWWGTTDAGAIAALAAGPATMDFDPYLLTPHIRMAFKGNRLVELQNDDGGWDWPLDDGNPGNTSPSNTIGPIGKALAKAYRATGDPDMLPALSNVGGYLLTKVTNFSPSDGYLAAELDSILGGAVYTQHVWDNFYTPLANGTYDRNGAGTLYSTADYVQLINDARAGQGIANLAAWDIGMGLVGAAAAGVGGTDMDDWIAGVETEIDELDGAASYDVIGLAGAVYALAYVDEDFDPTAGEHAAAGSLADLADILVSYQIVESGGFAWTRDYVIPYDCNETVQETSYAILALAEMGGYESEIAAAYDYLLSVQLSTGGWENYCGSGENNEVSAEGGWAVWDSDPSELTLVPDRDCYEATDTVTVELWMSDVAQEVVGGQFFLNYQAGMLTFVGAVAQAPFQNMGMNDSTPGELDYWVNITPPTSITGDALIATLTFTAVTGICTAEDLITWRPHDPPTRLSGNMGQAVYPDLLAMDVVDDEAPLITCPGSTTIECDEDSSPAGTGSATAVDNCDPAPVVTFADDVTPGACPQEEVIVRTWTATDNCGNISTCEQTITVEDTNAPAITCPPDATVECDADTSPASLGSATAVDNCDPAPAITFSDVVTPGACPPEEVITRTWMATDECGNAGTCVQTITVQDTTPPVITPMPDITVYADAGGCDAVVTWDDPVATDNCSAMASSFLDGFEADPYVPGDGENWNEYNSLVTRATSGTGGITSKSGAAHGVIDSSTTPVGDTGAFTRIGGYSSEFGVGFTTSLDIYMDLSDPAVVADTYGWDLSTAANDQTGVHTQDYIFHTASNPAGDILVGSSNNSGGTRRNDLESIDHHHITASGWYTFEWDFYDFGDATLAVDFNLYDGAGSLLWSRTYHNETPLYLATDVGGNRYMWFTFLEVDSLAIDNTAKATHGTLTVDVDPPSGSIFPEGDTTVTITATDDCGNMTESFFDVTVESFTEMVVDLSLDGTVNDPTTRCITFELFDCGGGGGGAAAIVEQEIEFVGGAASGVTVLVPCGNYTCVTARDRLHTLRSTQDGLTVSGAQYEATIANPLTGGNLNDDNWIDILDYGVFSWQFGPGGGDTDCSSTYPHADIDGDGVVDSDDFSFISNNFLETHDPDCCTTPSPLYGSQPVVSVSVHDLIARGLSELAAGDLNHDGWLDQQDIVAFINGARPNQIGVGGVNLPLSQNNK